MKRLLVLLFLFYSTASLAAGVSGTGFTIGSKSWKFALISDTHTISGEQSATNNQIIYNAILAEGDVEMVIFCGDLATSCWPTCGETAYAAGLSYWSSLVADLTAAGIEVYAIRGNHDAEQVNSITSWQAAFTFPSNGPAGEEELTYYVDHKNSRFVFVDEYMSWVDAEDRYVEPLVVNQSWINSTLSSAPKNKFVFIHEPPMGIIDTTSAYLPDTFTARQTFWAALETYGVNTLFCGHYHHFSLANASTSGYGVNGVKQCMVGGGTATGFCNGIHDVTTSNTPYKVDIIYDACNEGVTNLGYTLVTVDGDDTNDTTAKITWRVIAEDGVTVTDGYTLSSNMNR